MMIGNILGVTTLFNSYLPINYSDNDYWADLNIFTVMVIKRSKFIFIYICLSESFLE